MLVSALSVLRVPVRLSVECPRAAVQTGARDRLLFDPGARQFVGAEHHERLEIDAGDRLVVDAEHPHHLVAVLSEQAPALAEGFKGVVAGPLDLAGVPGDDQLLGLSVGQARLAEHAGIRWLIRSFIGRKRAPRADDPLTIFIVAT